MKDISIKFKEGTTPEEKTEIIERLVAETQAGSADLSSVPRLFSIEVEGMELAEACERLPKEYREKIEKIAAFEDAA